MAAGVAGAAQCRGPCASPFAAAVRCANRVCAGAWIAKPGCAAGCGWSGCGAVCCGPRGLGDVAGRRQPRTHAGRRGLAVVAVASGTFAAAADRRRVVKPYYADDTVRLYLGDCREVVPTLDIRPDCVVADPPYAETSLDWDRWPDGWPTVIAEFASSMWCFGSMRMFLERRDDFSTWKLSQEVVWEKPSGTNMAADRFKRVHEYALHWYRGRWGEVRHETPRERHLGPDRGQRHGGADRGKHFGSIRARMYEDNGTRLMRSVQRVDHMHGRAIHPTEKPLGILDPLIRYACPPGGIVLDPFAGSGSTAAAARMSGRRSVLIEADERYCEAIADRLAQDVLPAGGVS